MKKVHKTSLIYLLLLFLIMYDQSPNFLNFQGAQESIPRNQFRQAVVAWRAGTTTLFLLGS